MIFTCHLQRPKRPRRISVVHVVVVLPFILHNPAQPPLPRPSKLPKRSTSVQEDPFTLCAFPPAFINQSIRTTCPEALRTQHSVRMSCRSLPHKRIIVRCLRGTEAQKEQGTRQ